MPYLTKETHGKQFSCQKDRALLKSFTEDKDGQAAGSIEQSETGKREMEVKTEQRRKIMGLKGVLVRPQSDARVCLIWGLSREHRRKVLPFHAR